MYHVPFEDLSSICLVEDPAANRLASDRRRPRSPSPPPPCDRSRGSLRPTDLLQTGDGPVAGGSSSTAPSPAAPPPPPATPSRLAPDRQRPRRRRLLLLLQPLPARPAKATLSPTKTPQQKN
ncbi:hypothetical protein PGTUg99_015933 [Puccinia graminis f. sp. tritici]|uniref:Uncharacterized protein n=1 Tax=Puccinia graminis f. sp. tritici TaxID=56615 RepID=A0A5B0PJ85_PUCGR|nr:hypothetical protein PGTUg99_015933 [Puccinia graminis f. sp. tritici]